METTAHGFRLSNGREFRPYAGVIGLARRPEGWFVGGGYDAKILAASADLAEWEDNWTSEEQRELADYMIALWQEFRDRAAQPAVPSPARVFVVTKTDDDRLTLVAGVYPTLADAMASYPGVQFEAHPEVGEGHWYARLDREDIEIEERPIP